MCKDEEKAQNQKKDQQRPLTNGTSKNQQAADNKSKKNKKKTEAKNNQGMSCTINILVNFVHFCEQLTRSKIFN